MAKTFRKIADNVYLLNDQFNKGTGIFRELKPRKKPLYVWIHDQRIPNKSHTYKKAFSIAGGFKKAVELAKKHARDYKQRLDWPKEYKQLEAMKILTVKEMCRDYSRNVSLPKMRMSEAG